MTHMVVGETRVLSWSPRPVTAKSFSDLFRKDAPLGVKPRVVSISIDCLRDALSRRHTTEQVSGALGQGERHSRIYVCGFYMPSPSS